MINLAGNNKCDDVITEELKEAKIEAIGIYPQRTEVPYKLVGTLPGWSFTRAWYYWVAKASDGIGLPFDVADELHNKHGKDVRVAGHCGAPSPREWYNKPWNEGVPLYHIDTQEGLNSLASAIKSCQQ